GVGGGGRGGGGRVVGVVEGGPGGAVRTRVRVQRFRTAVVAHQDVGRSVVGIDPGTAVELCAREAGTRLVIGEVAVLPIPGVVAELLLPASPPTPDIP